MSILLGLLSLIASIAIPILIMVFTNYELISLGIFFVIPAGAIAIGYVCGFGLFKGLILSSKRITAKHFVIVMLMALISFASIKYITYSLTCINTETGKIEYSMDGDHVGNYDVPGYGSMTFLNYSKLMIESTPISFSYKSRSMGEVDNPTVSWVFAIINFIGIFIGAVAAGIGFKDKHQYCESCNNYKKSKKIFKILKTDGQSFFEELEMLTNDVSDSTSLKQIVGKYGKVKLGNAFFEGTLIYCNNCRKSTLSVKLFEVSSTNKIHENDEFEYNVNLNFNIAREYIKEDVA
jgi:hypothetical protein